MQLRPAALAGHLRGGPAPAYLIAGDETLLVEEACDAVVQAARRAGFGERSVLFVDGNFNWNDVLQDAASMSLFAERRIIDVRVPAGKLDREASEVLRRYAEHPPDDTLLLIRMRRLEPKQNLSAWFKALDALGVVVQVWPVKANELPRWLAGRLKKAGLTLDQDALTLFAERMEGNLLAAVQEIETLRLAGLDSPIGVETLTGVLDDAARYDAFDVLDAAFAGDAKRVVRMVRTLRQEGVSVFAVHGALTSRLRRLADGGNAGPRFDGFLRRVGGAAGIQQVLAECSLIDSQSKGQIPGEAWHSLEDLLLRLAGVEAFEGGPRLQWLR